jgi:hypothetical protein
MRVLKRLKIGSSVYVGVPARNIEGNEVGRAGTEQRAEPAVAGQLTHTRPNGTSKKDGVARSIGIGQVSGAQYRPASSEPGRDDQFDDVESHQRLVSEEHDCCAYILTPAFKRFDAQP